MKNGTTTDLATRRAQLEISAARAKAPLGIALKTCDPQGPPETRLFNCLAVHEPLISERAEREPTTMMVVLTDKSRQNPINKLGGAKEAGDQAMQGYWDALVETADLLARANSKKGIDATVIRVSPSSDEGILLFFGNGLDDKTVYQFSHAWSVVRSKLDLRKYRYSIRVGYGSSQEEYGLDLDAFSRVLRHPDMVVACNALVSKPRIILPYSKGFIREGIRKLEDSELSFYYLLPESFKGRGDGLAEVETPFDTNLERRGIRNQRNGVYVDIRLKPSSLDCACVLGCITDVPDISRGTRKGFSEVHSETFGMRGFNTFMGKAQANKVLTAIARGVYEAATELGCRALPTSGCYTRYWLDLKPEEPNAKIIEAAIEAKLREQFRGNNPFAPVVSMIDARGIGLNELRARFILQSLDQESKHYQILDRVDFLINFIENVQPRIQEQIFADMENGGFGERTLTSRDREYLSLVKMVCALRRTIRDTEDLVWTLRADGTLPDTVKEKKRDIEEWLYEFADSGFERMFRNLTQIIERTMKARSIS
ncbi:Uncharacterised protein [Candidatus Bilamarchaeum dharawalense]|uniref:Uncharacterized protein n=1 Tax=Candidatus Bilamarchaeum dharawalense TaxID=2885759 RepID=A0A5E4LQ33_9ARCH|nr:Uncharacterised protein [Candidatus Bilamarchaeum dharawalense]